MSSNPPNTVDPCTNAGSGDKGYTITASGTNSQGNHYCKRDYSSSSYTPPNANTYHYFNKDGSYYYSNPDGSTYHDDGKGGSTYTPPPN